MLRGPKLYPTVPRKWVADVGVDGLTEKDYLATLSRFERRVHPKRFAEITPDDVRDYVDFSSGTHGVVHVIPNGGKPAQVPLNAAARKLLFEWRGQFVEAVGNDIAGLRILLQARAVTVGNPMVRPQVRRVVMIWTRG